MNYTLTIDDVIDIIKKADLDNVQIVERFKNDLFRRNRGISISAAKEFIKTLTVSDLITGPIDDDNPNRKHPV